MQVASAQGLRMAETGAPYASAACPANQQPCGLMKTNTPSRQGGRQEESTVALQPAHLSLNTGSRRCSRATLLRSVTLLTSPTLTFTLLHAWASARGPGRARGDKPGRQRPVSRSTSTDNESGASSTAWPCMHPPPDPTDMLRVNPASCMRADSPSAFSMYTVSTPLQGRTGRKAAAFSEQGFSRHRLTNGQLDHPPQGTRQRGRVTSCNWVSRQPNRLVTI